MSVLCYIMLSRHTYVKVLYYFVISLISSLQIHTMLMVIVTVPFVWTVYVTVCCVHVTIWSHVCSAQNRCWIGVMDAQSVARISLTSSRCSTRKSYGSWQLVMLLLLWLPLLLLLLLHLRELRILCKVVCMYIFISIYKLLFFVAVVNIMYMSLLFRTIIHN